MTAEILAWAGRQLTLPDWEAMPKDEQFRLELVEGVLSIMQQPLSLHQRAVMRLGYRLDERVPPELTAVIEVEVVVTAQPLTIRIPDVLVTRASVIDANPPRVAAADVLLAVEILSNGTRKVDRILKFAEYAEAQIPQYWIIDLDDAPSLRAFTLVEDAYELSGEFTAAVTLDVAGHAVTVDPAALTRR
ncbi:MAG TPA: Uma2 family endonuclease [Pseudonocardia sp.]